MKFAASFALAALALTGCLNQMDFEVKDSDDAAYKAKGRTDRPESVLRVLGRNEREKIYAKAYAEAVRNGRAYPYRGGATGSYAHHYCGGGTEPCLAPPQAPRQTAAPEAANAKDGEQDKKLDALYETIQQMRAAEGDGS